MTRIAAAGEYLGRLHRVNLLTRHPGDAWPTMAAADRAAEIHDWVVDDWRVRCWDRTGTANAVDVKVLRVLLLGKRVGEAFGMEAPFTESDHHGVVYRLIPHPSGKSLAYNDENARVGARAAVLWAAGYI